MSRAIAKISLDRARDQLGSFAFVLPAVAIFAVFYIYPFFEIFNLSLRSWNGISLQSTFIGLKNFVDLMQDRLWWGALGHAAYITLWALTFQNLIAFALALVCDRNIKLQKFYRVVFFIPPVLSEVVVGLIWTWILYAGTQEGQHIGLLNHVLHITGLDALIHNWLSDPKTTLTCIAVVHCWKGFGWGFIMLLAGLQTIDKQLYEASKIDGAGWWGTFWHVTVPMMMPVIVVVMILTILGSMQAFVLILSMVSQGLVNHTDVPVTRIFASMNTTNQFGYACAQGIIFALILITVSFGMKVISNRFKQA